MNSLTTSIHNLSDNKGLQDRIVSLAGRIVDYETSKSLLISNMDTMITDLSELEKRMNSTEEMKSNTSEEVINILNNKKVDSVTSLNLLRRDNEHLLSQFENAKKISDTLHLKLQEQSERFNTLNVQLKDYDQIENKVSSDQLVSTNIRQQNLQNIGNDILQNNHLLDEKTKSTHEKYDESNIISNQNENQVENIQQLSSENNQKGVIHVNFSEKRINDATSNAQRKIEIQNLDQKITSLKSIRQESNEQQDRETCRNQSFVKRSEELENEVTKMKSEVDSQLKTMDTIREQLNILENKVSMFHSSLFHNLRFIFFSHKKPNQL